MTKKTFVLSFTILAVLLVSCSKRIPTEPAYPAASPTVSFTGTITPTSTITETATNSTTTSPTFTDTITPTYTASPTDTPTFTATDTPTDTITPSVTETGTDTATFTATGTFTSTGTDTATPTFSPTFTVTMTHTASPTSTITPLSMLFAKELYPDASYTVMQDTELDSYSPATSQYISYGRCDSLNIAYTVSNERSLLKFDISAIPATAIVAGASIRVNAYYYHDPYDRAPITIHVKRLTRDWEQRNLCFSQVYWNSNYPTWRGNGLGTSWTVNGGDYDEEIGLYNAYAAGIYTIPLTASVVQGWVNGTLPNYGFGMIPDVTEFGTVSIRSSEYTTAADRPTLTVYYYLP